VSLPFGTLRVVVCPHAAAAGLGPYLAAPGNGRLAPVVPAPAIAGDPAPW